ncbi:MAG: tRNA (N6-isopentenyl adenosine(37)-C2)-methylthiotransferase MiaB [Planctomycetes bacterium]|nr:tRNA (N6-isopentenyl adenosine(37)-C2)-methylthiotransferase MiaB [Planctomycetota bacterium]
MTHRLYIETVGCQMNVLDSEMVVASLRRHGYEVVDDPLSADTILFNTCSVRQHAEEKIYSALGKLRQHKRRHPEKIIGVMGCMAQKDQQRIFERAPYVDLIVGPGQLNQTAELIDRARQGQGRQMALSLGRRDGSADAIRRSHETFDPLRDPTMRPTPFQAYLRIQIGCDKFCTYCVVPMTRGPEQGRPPKHILDEARLLADQGCKEITLLGQTVNSYRYRDGGRTTTLADLLYQLHGIEGIQRLKFVTNYPKDMTPDLLQAARDLPKCSHYLHVPLQSGSNRILQSMKRGYTVEEYREMMQRIRELLPGAAVSSDFIVGFCGETEEDFEATVQMVQECRFKNSFIFKYSERAGTKAAERMPDDVPEEVKRRRNRHLLALQDAISEDDNQTFLGQTVEVLVEGPSKAAEKAGEDGPVMQLTGRTMCDRIVVFPANRRLVGEVMPVVIHDCTAHTLIGEIVTGHAGPELFTLDTSPSLTAGP